MNIDDYVLVQLLGFCRNMSKEQLSLSLCTMLYN